MMFSVCSLADRRNFSLKRYGRGLLQIRRKEVYFVFVFISSQFHVVKTVSISRLENYFSKNIKIPDDL